MEGAENNSGSNEPIEQQAANWVWRCDRGLSAAEQDEFSSWLAANPAHGEQLARFRSHWRRLDRLADWRPEHGAQPNPDLLAVLPKRRRKFSIIYPSLALAAAAALAIGFFWRSAPRVETDARPPTTVASSTSSQQVLPDGSIIELNAGAVIAADLSGEERRVRLEKGEAHFLVAKDPNRPFVVIAQGIEVRALGTAFNVRLGSSAVEVLVTEGRIQVDASRPGENGDSRSREPSARHNAFDPSRDPSMPPPLVPALEARQRVIVSLAAHPEVSPIATLTVGEIARVLAWQHGLLQFNATPLREIVAEFNRRNGTQMVITDADLAALPITVSSFRSDNVDGFIRLLEVGFGVIVERKSDTEILLHRAR